jgi:hypothetical protein
MKSSKLNRLLEFGFLLVSAIALVAEEPVASPTPAEEPAEVEIESPSPDGRFAFLSSFTPDERTLDLSRRNRKRFCFESLNPDKTPIGLILRCFGRPIPNGSRL